MKNQKPKAKAQLVITRETFDKFLEVCGDEKKWLFADRLVRDALSRVMADRAADKNQGGLP